MRALARRVTPSMVIACIALGVALSGSSVAANVKNAINGSRVAKNTLPGNRVKSGSLPANKIVRNSLTGRQINESRLRRVPKAGVAQRALDAAALGGRPASAYRPLASGPIPSGTTVSGAFGLSANIIGGATQVDLRQVVSLPGLATTDLTSATVNFGNAAAVGDPDPSCTGTAAAPTAPPGRVCLYLSASVGMSTTVTGEAIPLLAGSRSGFVVQAVQADAATGVFGAWAYTAQ